MEPYIVKRIRQLLNAEYVKRLLIKYFVSKGYDDFDNYVLPTDILDIQKIPELSDKIEIIPNSDEFDPTTGKVVVQWNLFVLGTKRMYLGRTNHKSLSDLANIGVNVVDRSTSVPEKESSVKDIINFIVSVVKKSRRGMVDIGSVEQPVSSPLSHKSNASPTPISSFWEKRRLFNK